MHVIANAAVSAAVNDHDASLPSSALATAALDFSRSAARVAGVPLNEPAARVAGVPLNEPAAIDWQTKYYKQAVRTTKCKEKIAVLKAKLVSSEVTNGWFKTRLITADERVAELESRLQVRGWQEEVLNDIFVTVKSVLNK